MSEKNPTPPNLPLATALPAESQAQRWIKYGSNVVLTTVVAIALAVVLILLGQRWRLRHDATAGHTHSLSAATVDLIRQQPTKIKLVSLYTKVRRDEEAGKADSGEAAIRAREVSDLLDEYARKGNNITVETIDSYAEPAKLTALFDEVSKNYGNNVGRYRTALDDFSKTVDEITKAIDQETKAIKAVPSSKNQNLKLTMSLLRQTIDQFPEDLRDLQSTLPAELTKQSPDYKRATDAAKAKLGDLSQNIQGMIDGFKRSNDELKPIVTDLEGKVAAESPAAATQPSVDRQNLETIRTYLTYANQSTARFAAIKKQADDLISRLGNLGELKQLDDLRAKKTDSIVVMGEKDMIVIPRDRVFRKPARENEGEKKAFEFAGEQQISTAIMVLNSPSRPRVAFVRNGGPPLTLRLDIEQGTYTGPLYYIGEALRQYNFDVVERDFSDEWSMQLRQIRQQHPGVDIPDEATEEQLKDAVWIARPGPPTPPEAMGQQPPNMVGQKIDEHINSGGSALVMFSPGDDTMTQHLLGWGISVHTNRIAVHEKPPETEGRVSDQIEDLKRQQYFFELNHYGDHPITRPLQSMNSFLMAPIPILLTEEKGFTATRLMPIVDGSLKVWDKDIRTIRGADIAFDPGNDGTGPLNAAVAVEQAVGPNAGSSGGRLVVLGCGDFAGNQWATLRERDVQRGGSNALRFPANSEFVTNSVFWLSRMENMMSISPASRTVPLIAAISPISMGVWRVLVLLFVPVLVLALGGRIYFARRD